MDGANSIELTTQHANGKKKDKVFKSMSILKKTKNGIPEKALKLFEGRK